MVDLTCEECQSLIPELALGIVHGRERADALAHIEHCPVCQHELLLMGDLADRLVELTPSAEPPPGFETRVLAAVQAPRPARSAPAPRPGFAAGVRVRWFRPAALSLAAAALAALVGVGGWALGHHSADTVPAVAGGGRATVATLVADHRDVGQVVVTGGDYPWVSMAVDTGTGNRKVTCQLRERNGRTVTLGSFALSDGQGYWTAPIPATSSPVIGAQLVDAAGSTVASAAITVAPAE
jgi:hypothetical protein